MIEGIVRLKALILKHLREELTSSEQDELQHWINHSEENRELFGQLTDPDKLRKNMQEFHEARATIWDKIDLQVAEEKAARESDTRETDTSDTPRTKRRIWAYAAAASLLLLSTGIYLLQLRSSGPATSANIAGGLQDIPPGGNKASLTLANGSVILLEKRVNGRLAEQGTTSITKDSNLLAYTAALPAADQPPASFNTLTTPRSGQFQLVLPDGSKVWLNNASSLRYPVSFQGPSREVTLLSGEAYFEIVPITYPGEHSRIPFTVKINGLAINVLGTSFNISAYPDEESIKTTLITGKVQLAGTQHQAILEPGEQAVIGRDQIILGRGQEWTIRKDVDTDEAIAWIRGYFHFNHENIREVLQQLARWYDVEVEFRIPAPDYSFDGEIGRDLTLLAILKHLEKKDMHFHIEGKKLIVSKE
jgi:transmembrane sensor